ncbi:MAG: single-stranded DNA-binding protein [Victivallaceae bacterium]|jgi:single-strand DNA-binding protein|nr:single-stranded DNA-binding protein [Victivallaceae bacterium]NLK82968.1 single-stranded DNA-binding protein [Lentisphaerota bacterium]MDD3115880.1 single-stranded DNA-binding protein [Victivallaceae bacterium]MDD3703206.1 single-stranded DNA-binding protein [Victivallaceae bacterium]MDD4317087.1 single-stranded DNA-binding protein [Victivallaceae bacterium]
MASLNKVILLGNLTRDPELRYTNSGVAVCEFGLAVNRRSGDPNRDEVCFVDIVVWDKQAESSGRILQKGAPVLIEGRLQLDQWQDRETGQKRSRLRVVAERVQFIGSRSDRGIDDGGDSYQPRAGATQPPRSNYGAAPAASPRQEKSGSYPRPEPQGRNTYQAPPASDNQAPPMPNDAFEVGGDGAEDDIPF